MSNIIYMGLEPENIPTGTQATVPQPDLKEVVAAASTGDVDAVASSVGTFTNRALASLSNPMVLGPMAIIYALKGKLSPFERGVLGVIGAFSLYNFTKSKSGEQKPWQQQFLTQSNQATPSQSLHETDSEILADGKKSTT